MNKTLLLFLLIFSAACVSKKPAENNYLITTRILSYNVKNCLGMDGITDYKRVADIINRIGPEIVALQELDSATQRSNGNVILDKLAQYTGMYGTYGASIDYQGGKYGIGILTKEKPVAWKRIPLPGREEKRSLLIVELKHLVIGCTHFSLNAEDRLASAEIANTAFSDYSKPVLMAGDLNAVTGSPVIESIKKKWNILNDPSVPTIPSNQPRNCIDFILGLKSPAYVFDTGQTVVVPEPVASDHLPVWAIVNIR